MTNDKSDKIVNELCGVLYGETTTELYDNIAYILETLRNFHIIENEEYENIDIKLGKAFGYEVEYEHCCKL